MDRARVLIGGFPIAEAELSWSAVRSGGPGGQNVNKVSTKVVLRFSFEMSDALTFGQKARLRERFAGYLTKEGELVIASDETRSQETNRERAFERLGKILSAVRSPPKKRIGTKPTRASKERRLEAKSRQGQLKKARRAGAE